MIETRDAIAESRRHIGTPYGNRPGELDCINLIKLVIRNAAGGVKDYTTAGTNSLWKSYDMAKKYRDLTWRQEGIANARAGMIAFKASGENYHHAGIVTEAGTVVHASSVYGETVETPLTKAEGWTHLAVHRHIAVKEEKTMVKETLFKAVVDTAKGPLNMRELPAGNAMVIEKIPKGETVEVLEKTNMEWWEVRYKGEVGYCSEEYLSRIVEPETGETAAEEAIVQIVITDEAGNVFRPVGAYKTDIEVLMDGESID